MKRISDDQEKLHNTAEIRLLNINLVNVPKTRYTVFAQAININIKKKKNAQSRLTPCHSSLLFICR